ncbi:hypothetical protein ACOMHN_044298 [Nucella lapillus]
MKRRAQNCFLETLLWLMTVVRSGDLGENLSRDSKTGSQTTAHGGILPDIQTSGKHNSQTDTPNSIWGMAFRTTVLISLMNTYPCWEMFCSSLEKRLAMKLDPKHLDQAGIPFPDK